MNKFKLIQQIIIHFGFMIFIILGLNVLVKADMIPPGGEYKKQVYKMPQIKTEQDYPDYSFYLGLMFNSSNPDHPKLNMLSPQSLTPSNSISVPWDGISHAWLIAVRKDFAASHTEDQIKSEIEKAVTKGSTSDIKVSSSFAPRNKASNGDNLTIKKLDENGLELMNDPKTFDTQVNNNPSQTDSGLVSRIWIIASIVLAVLILIFGIWLSRKANSKDDKKSTNS